MREQLLTSRELAERFQIHTDTPKSWRHKGRGPAWVRIGGAVRYRILDIEAYEEKRKNKRDTA